MVVEAVRVKASEMNLNWIKFTFYNIHHPSDNLFIYLFLAL